MLKLLTAGFSIRAGDRRNSPATWHDFAANFDWELRQMRRTAWSIFLQNTILDCTGQHLFIKVEKERPERFPQWRGFSKKLWIEGRKILPIDWNLFIFSFPKTEESDKSRDTIPKRHDLSLTCGTWSWLSCVACSSLADCRGSITSPFVLHSSLYCSSNTSSDSWTLLLSAKYAMIKQSSLSVKAT